VANVSLVKFKQGTIVNVYSYLRVIKILKSIGLDLSACQIRDPRVAAWLIDPEALGNLASLIQTYIPDIVDSNKPRDSKYDSLYTLQLMRNLKAKLVDVDLHSYFECVEMPLHLCLARIEHKGIRFDSACFEEIKGIIEDRMGEIEVLGNQRMNNIVFSWDSNKELFEILFMELELPHPDYPDLDMEKPKQFISKGLLERIESDDPFPSYILERNRLKYTTALIVVPLSDAIERDGEGTMIHCQQDPFTVRLRMKWLIECQLEG
jgi:DNA polymerase I-like protein with 3'-5' exonuclease and polymerase domains